MSKFTKYISSECKSAISVYPLRISFNKQAINEFNIDKHEYCNVFYCNESEQLAFEFKDKATKGSLVISKTNNGERSVSFLGIKNRFKLGVLVGNKFNLSKSNHYHHVGIVCVAKLNKDTK